MHCIIMNILTELTLKKSKKRNKNNGTLRVRKFIARIAEKSLKEKPGLAEVTVVDARGAWKQT